MGRSTAGSTSTKISNIRVVDVWQAAIDDTELPRHQPILPMAASLQS